MKTVWVKRLLVLLLWGVVGGVLGAGTSIGIDYGSEHWWHGNNYVIGLLLAAPAMLAKEILGIRAPGISNEFCDVVYGFIGFCGFVFIGLAWQFTRRIRGKK
jgi:hypothetical protein